MLTPWPGTIVGSRQARQDAPLASSLRLNKPSSWPCPGCLGSPCPLPFLGIPNFLLRSQYSLYTWHVTYGVYGVIIAASQQRPPGQPCLQPLNLWLLWTKLIAAPPRSHYYSRCAALWLIHIQVRSRYTQLSCSPRGLHYPPPLLSFFNPFFVSFRDLFVPLHTTSIYQPLFLPSSFRFHPFSNPAFSATFRLEVSGILSLN